MRPGLDAIARLVAERTGMRIGPAQQAWLSAAVTRVAERLGAEDQDIALMARRDDFVAQLIDEVTIRETFFLREVEQLRSIDWRAALDTARAAGRETIRVWSAGCASGEEPYTLAMLAVDALGPAAPVSVLGTDISAAALASARRGWYSGRTVRRLDENLLTRYFEPRDGGIAVRSPLRECVRFRRHNLVGEPSPPRYEDRFDVVVCRNVLIHFEPAAAECAGTGLMAGLHPQGTLLLGPADRLCLTSPALAALARGTEAAPRRRHSITVAPGLRRRHEPRPPRDRAAPSAPARGSAADGGGTQAEILEGAMRLADADRLEDALELAAKAAADAPLDASAHLVAGVIEIAMGAPERAVDSLRRAVYLDPSVAIAAFHLGRARDATGERAAARQAYEHALHALDPDDRRHGWLLDPVDVVDVAEACRLRLLDLREP